MISTNLTKFWQNIKGNLWGIKDDLVNKRKPQVFDVQLLPQLQHRRSQCIPVNRLLRPMCSILFKDHI